MTACVPAGVAAHHPDTAAVGLEILDSGGTAADAAVAATLASCVAETTMTGLCGGGHGIHYDAATGRVDVIDFFVAIPGLDGKEHGGEPVTVDMLFEDEAVPYVIGPGSVGVPGVVAGCGALSSKFGQLPWERLVKPALRLAVEDTILPPTHARVLEMLAPALTLNEGAAIYAPQGRLLAGGDTLHQPGLVTALQLLADEGPDSFYRGTIAHAIADLLAERGGAMTLVDLEAYEVLWPVPVTAEFAGTTVYGREDLGGVVATLGRLPDLAGADDATRAVAFARALGGPQCHGDTTNVSVVDHAGNACAVTTSLGLGSSDWVRGMDLHLNSMLGERDLLTGPLVAGGRLGSMMCPLVALDDDGLAACAGAAGGSRIRSALVQVMSGVLAEGLDAVAAVDRPRLHVDGRITHLEPGFPSEGEQALRDDGFITRNWRTRHHFFGGVGVVSRSGVSGEPRRDGAAGLARSPSG